MYVNIINFKITKIKLVIKIESIIFQNINSQLNVCKILSNKKN